ncbi:MAG: TrkA family potassium uptake protein [Chloroflexi bacterium]|nr:TrkA family potassium uptake protein [Chloroflexota bacterium]
MYIIVVGGGKIGFSLSQALLSAGHELLCIERDPRRCAVIAEDLGSAVSQGDGCEVAVLEEAGTARADAFVAVTGDDEDNLIACQVAKQRFRVPRTIARINNPKNKEIFLVLGVDATVNSTEIIMAQLAQEMPLHPLIPILTLKGTGRELVDVQITADSPVVGVRLGELRLPGQSSIALIIDRGRSVHAASPDTVLGEEDEVIAVTRPEDEEALRELLAGPS